MGAGHLLSVKALSMVSTLPSMTSSAIPGGKLVEHWDTIKAVPARSEWKNNNGKF
jgi:predicted SnoaL-like aldol condensation-catalyzing enzyme